MSEAGANSARLVEVRPYGDTQIDGGFAVAFESEMETCVPLTLEDVKARIRDAVETALDEEKAPSFRADRA